LALSVGLPLKETFQKVLTLGPCWNNVGPLFTDSSQQSTPSSRVQDDRFSVVCSPTEFPMFTLMTVVRYEIIFLLAGLGAVVGYQIITGRINTKGLLFETRDVGFSPARLQLLMFTFGVAFYVLGKVLALGAFPEIDPNVLVVLGGSHALYLGAKALPQSVSKPDNSNN
jgi:hypothetical protein